MPDLNIILKQETDEWHVLFNVGDKRITAKFDSCINATEFVNDLNNATAVSY